MLEASIIIIGDEILAGSVNDANGHLAAGRLRRHGIPLTGVHVIPDDHTAIAGALRTELDRTRPRLIITSGGIGSTPDDVTFAAIAATLDLELLLASDDVAAFEGEVEALRARGFAVGDEERADALSMAVVPEGSEVLRHSGWLCGIKLHVDGGIDHEGATIVALPGIPSYFRTVLDDVIVPDVLEGRGVGHTVGEVEHELPEIVLGPELKQIVDRWPGVRVGSYPGQPMLVRVYGPADEVEAATTELSERLARLQRGEQPDDDRPPDRGGRG